MLIDITRCPLVLIPDECPSSVIIRAASGRDISGMVWKEASENDRKRYKSEWSELPPTASLDRGNMVYLETRLPLREAKDLTPLASIFEVASVHPGGNWRIRVALSYKAVPKLWHVYIEAVTATDKAALVMVSARGLSSERIQLHEEKLPLMRVQGKDLGAEMPVTIWSRLMED